MSGDVLLVGISARALADSAVRSGYRPVTVDFFGDLDHKRAVRNLALGRDLGRTWSAAAAVEAAAALRAPTVAYGADLENAPDAVARLARNRELLGNTPAVLARVRDPAALFAVLGRAGVPTPATVFPGGASSLSPARFQGATEQGAAGRAWLLKPARGGGGGGMAVVDRWSRPAAREILQELVEGPCLSLAFLADGVRTRPLALSLQIDDREAFGAAAFAYVGSLSGLPAGVPEDAIREQAFRAAAAVAEAFGLRGWNGMDFIVRNGEVVPIEINPRHTSSMELLDTAASRLFQAHLDACRGRLSGTWLPVPAEVSGKAILFARRDVRVGESTRWLTNVPRPEPARDADGPPWPERRVADVPYPGETIRRGRPVCTLYATAISNEECSRRLRELADLVERDLDDA